jgi:hypothetical protein
MLFALVDGRRSVGDIVRLLGRGDFAVVSGLAELISRGLLIAGESDAVADLSRKYDVLAQLETAVPALPQPQSETAPAVEPMATPLPEPIAAYDDEIEDDDGEDDEEIVANIDAPAEPPPSKPLAPVAPPQRTGVTPQRPEPVLPQRQPDFPEPGVPAAVAGGSVAAMPAPAIERDPGVNKSLLLRLIAGVRGL